MSGGTPGPPPSPYQFYSCGDYQGKIISFTVSFDGAQNLTSATAFRDPACVYTKIYIGLGPDGTPDTTTKKFTVPAGTTNITQAQLNAVGLVKLADATALQITAGP